MVRTTLAAAAVLMAFSGTGALAQDMPRRDPMVEQALIEKLQTRLPPMRPAYDLRSAASLPQPRNGLEALATMDATQQPARKYTGRIIWM